MHNAFETHSAGPRVSDAVQLYAYALLGMSATIFFLALFLHMPIGTEARDYVFYRGYLAQAGNWRDLFYPVGANGRLVSMALFAMSRDACGFGATCLNVVQIALLLLCVFFGAVHLHQLLRRPVLVACAMALWCLSLPVFSAGLWQATQHDKLAFMFSLAALSYGFSAMRRNAKGSGFLVSTVLLLALFVLALNAKETAFLLPAAAMSQILLLGPAGSFRKRLVAARVYVLPVGFAALYIGDHLLRFGAVLPGRALTGDLAHNAHFYLLALMGRQSSSVLGSIVVLALLVAITGYAATKGRGDTAMAGAQRVLAYLAVLFIANMVQVAPALYPDNSYILPAEWAFFGMMATVFVLLLQADRVARYAGLGAIALLLLIFLHKRVGDTFGWGSSEVLREGGVLNGDYTRLRPYCGPQMAQGMKFVFPERPLGFFYFFTGGDEGPEKLLVPFICETATAAPIAYDYTGDLKPDHPGELVVAFNSDLTIRVVSKK